MDSSATSINLFTSPEMANDPVHSAKLTAASIASLAAARIESGDLSADLTSQLHEISRQLAEAESQNRLTEAELVARAKSLEREARTLTDLRQDFETSRDEWQASHEQLIKSQRQWTQQVQKQDTILQQRLDTLEARSRQLKSMPMVSGDGSEECMYAPVVESRISHQREAQLEAMLRESEDCENELQSEIRVLEEQIASLTKELEKALGTGAERLMREDYAAMTEELKSAHHDADRLRHQLGKQNAEMELMTLQKERVPSGRRTGEASSEDAIFASIRSLVGKAEDHSTSDEEALREELMEQVRAEKEALQREYEEKEASYQKALEESEQRFENLKVEYAASLPQPEEATSRAEETARFEEEMDFHVRRYEMAMDDIKELNADNETLKRDLKEAVAQAAFGNLAENGSANKTEEILDWEEEKLRLMTMLESDFNDGVNDSPEQQASGNIKRIKIEDVIDQTDRILHIKTKEVEELRVLLENQSSQVGNLAVGVGAFEAAFGQDELIVEERENLKRLQQELHEKLKKAEIEISLERAKVARERAEMDDMLLSLGLTKEKIHEAIENSSKEEAANKAEKRRAINPKANKQARWFDQMGLEEEGD